MRPVKVKKLDGDGLEIEWSDGLMSVLSASKLRDNCPSAASKAKRGDTSHDKPLGLSKLVVVEESADVSYKLEEVWPIGNYAIGLRWADGHDSGIFTFEHLRELSE